MKDFNYSRFTTLLKHDIIEKRREYSRFALGVFIAFFLLIFVFSYEQCLIMSNEPETGLNFRSVGNFLEGSVGMTISLAIMFIIVSVSAIFSNMNTKQERIRFLMLPATNLEKFICRWFQFVVLGSLLVIFCYFAADIACWLVRHILGHSLGISIPFFCKSLYHTLFFDATVQWPSHQVTYTFAPKAALFYVAMLSTYLLGGTIFRRVPYIFTTCVLIAGALFLMIASTTIMGFLMLHDLIIPIIEWFENHNIFTPLFYTLTSAWIVFCHGLSYRLFCRCNVITHKAFGL